MEDAAAQKCIGQLFFRVGGDNDDGACFGLDGLLGLGNVKFHFIQLPQQVVGEFQVGLVDLVDQKNHLLLGAESLAQLAQLYILLYILHIAAAKLAVVQALHNIVKIRAVLCFGGAFDAPDDQLLAQCGGNAFGQLGFAGAGLALDQKGLLQGHADIYGAHQVGACYIILTAFKSKIGLHTSGSP